MKDLAEQACRFLDEQIRTWDLLQRHCALVEAAPVRTFEFGPFTVRLQLNNLRLNSTMSQINPASIEKRPCFLCDHNRPAEQKSFPCRYGFKFLCNPFPILPRHFTIVHEQHRPQRILDGLDAMLDLSQELGDEFVVFYNGPECGASAPDHLHLQAATRGVMPIDTECVHAPDEALRRFAVIESRQRDVARDRFMKLYEACGALQPQRIEPMMNVICSHDSNGWRLIVFPRGAHRPELFLEPEHSRLLVSPGTIDMGGIVILPMERDFSRMTRQHVEQMYRQVTISSELFERLVDGIRS